MSQKHWVYSTNNPKGVKKKKKKIRMHTQVTIKLFMLMLINIKLIMIHYKILLLWPIVLPKHHRLGIRAGSKLVMVAAVSYRLQVVSLTDVQRVSQHQVTQAPQCIRHSGVGSFALQPVSGKSALLLFRQVSISPLSCYGNTGFLIRVLHKNFNQLFKITRYANQNVCLRKVVLSIYKFMFYQTCFYILFMSTIITLSKHFYTNLS